MFLKPKSTHLNNLAILYKRYLDLSTFLRTDTLYKTVDNLYWTFDKNGATFIQYSGTIASGTSSAIIGNNQAVYFSGIGYFTYNTSTSTWSDATETTSASTIISNGGNNDIGYGQKSIFIKKDTFDYTIMGDINISEEQIIKGLLTDLVTFDIKWSDDIDISDDDIIQIDGDLYMVSDIKVKILRSPKPLKFYYCTLNKIHQ